jgi:Tol biopolymer transport system component
MNIWRMDADGANLKQLTAGNNENRNPHCTADGRWVVYESTSAAKTTLWKVPFDGGEPTQLTTQPSQKAVVSPDSKWVFYESTDAPKDVSFSIAPAGSWVANNATGEMTIWKVSIDGGKPTPFVNRYNLEPIISRQGHLMDPVMSPDGKMVACRYQPDAEKDVWKVAIFSLKGIPIQVFDISAHPFWDWVGFRWSPDGKAITYRVHNLSNGADNLADQPMDGGPGKQLTNFSSDQIFSFAWSSNGQLAMSRGREKRDLVLFTGLQ